MEQHLTDLKPSAEIQAVVMQLWNVIRETTQAASGAVSERNAIQKKHTALENTLVLEQQKTAKMQHYIEHLEREAKAKEEEFTKLQQQYRDGQEISRHREESVQELRRTQMEKEEHLSRLNAQIQEQARIIAERVAEIVAQEDDLERLRDELGISNDRAMQASERLIELEPLYIESQEEKALLGEEVERLRWQLTAVTEQTAQERTMLDAEYERKLTDAHAENGRLLLAVEDLKRVQGESQQRIRVLEEERDVERTTAQEQLQKAQQDAQTWQQIAEEQEQTFSVKEQALREETTRLASDSSKTVQLQEELQTLQNLLVLEKAAHEQAVQSIKKSHEQAVTQALDDLREHLTSEVEQTRAEVHTARELTQQYEQELTSLKDELETAQMRASQLEAQHSALHATITAEKEHAHSTATQALERLHALEEEYSTLKNTHETILFARSNELSELQARLEEEQHRSTSTLDNAKREAQIRMETELDATRQVMSMKDREIELLRVSVETLQANSNRAAQTADEKETRISELETLLTELETQRTKLEQELDTVSHTVSMNSAEREALAGKVRQMLSRVEAALEEEVR